MTAPLFYERVLPRFYVIVIPILLALASFAVALPFGGYLAIGVSFAVFALTCTALVLKSPVIRISAGYLWVGAASIELANLGAVEVISREEKSRELGPSLNAKAYVCIQGSIDELVKVSLADESDPTPYWIFSTRKGAQLLKLLG